MNLVHIPGPVSEPMFKHADYNRNWLSHSIMKKISMSIFLDNILRSICVPSAGGGKKTNPSFQNKLDMYNFVGALNNS